MTTNHRIDELLDIIENEAQSGSERPQQAHTMCEVIVRIIRDYRERRRAGSPVVEDILKGEIPYLEPVKDRGLAQEVAAHLEWRRETHHTYECPSCKVGDRYRSPTIQNQDFGKSGGFT